MVRYTKMLEDELRAVDFTKSNFKEKVKNIVAKYGLPSGAGKISKISMINVEDKYHSLNKIIDDDVSKYKDVYHEFLLVTNLVLQHVENKQKVDSTLIKGAIARLVNETKGEHHYSRLLMYTHLHTADKFIIGHMVNCAILTVGFSSFLGMKKNDLNKIGLCAYLHDIAMIYYYNTVNQERKLTEEEFVRMKNHTKESGVIIREIISDSLASIAVDVHEREMGQGYPEGKTGDQISIWTKIISICDVYISLIQRRSYRENYSPFMAIKMIIDMKGKLLDERLIKKFVDYMSIYPVNSFVYLDSGEIARVFRSNPGYPIKPVVQIIIDQNNHFQKKLKLTDLKGNKFVNITGVVDKEKENEIMSILIEQDKI